MKIDIESPMQQAFKEACDGYIPVFRGEVLMPEGADATASLQNLGKLLKAGLKVESVVLGEKQSVLVRFASGESYLATGFSWGEDHRETQELASFVKFLSDAGFGSRQKIYSILSKFPEDMRGGLLRTQFCDDYSDSSGGSVETAQLKVLRI